MHSPLVRSTLAWLLGLVAADRLLAPQREGPLLWMGLAACALLLGLLAQRLGGARPRARGAALLALCATLGAARAAQARPVLGPDHVASWVDAGPLLMRGHVAREPDRRDRQTHYALRVQSLRPDRPGAAWREARGLVLLQAPRHPPRAYGDLLRVAAPLEAPPVLDGFDYRAYLARQGIHALARRPAIHTLDRGDGASPRRALIALRDRGRRVLAGALPAPESALATGILLGDERGIPAALDEAFRVTGTSHVIAISGSNIALLVLAINALAGRVLGRRRSAPLTLAVVAAYALLVGADAAVVRAALMGAILVLGQALGRALHAPTALAAAALAMTAWEPRVVHDLGFQLSFAATAGLLAFAARFTEATRAWLTPRLGASRARAALRLAQDALLVTAAAQLTTWPVVAYHTGRVSLVSLLSNALILPAQPAIMGLGALTLCLGLVWAPLARPAGLLVWVPLTWTIRVVEATARWPLAEVTWRMPALALAAYFAALGAAAWRPAHRWAGDRIRKSGPRAHGSWLGRAARRVFGWSGVAAAAGLAALAWAGALRTPDGLLHVHVLDVGQGDAILIVAPGGQRMLVDAGAGRSAVLAELGRRLPPWDRRLDVVLLSHPDADHVGGMAAVLERYEVGWLVEPEVEHETPDAAAWRAAGRRERASGAEHAFGASGGRIWLDEAAGVVAEILWPPPGPAPAGADVNERSLVLRLGWGRSRLLLTGDIEQGTEAALVSADAGLEAGLLKVAHHGSDTSTTEAFLQAVSPRLALISVGADNRFGHPDPDVLGRLEASGAQVARTDIDGAVEVVGDGKAWWWRDD